MTDDDIRKMDYIWRISGMQTVLNVLFGIVLVIIMIVIIDMLNVSHSQDQTLKEMKEEIEKFEQTTRIKHDCR